MVACTGSILWCRPIHGCGWEHTAAGTWGLFCSCLRLVLGESVRQWWDSKKLTCGACCEACWHRSGASAGAAWHDATQASAKQHNAALQIPGGVAHRGMPLIQLDVQGMGERCTCWAYSVLDTSAKWYGTWQQLCVCRRIGGCLLLHSSL